MCSSPIMNLPIGLAQKWYKNNQNGPKMVQNGPPLQMHFRRIEIKDKSTCTSFKQTYADPDLTFTLNFKFVSNEF